MQSSLTYLLVLPSEVVGEAEDGEWALACMRELQPDVAVLDVDMPPRDGLAVAR